MFLEFFWPKELKQAIAECKVAGKLNEEAVENLQKMSTIMFIFATFLSLLFFFAADHLIGMGFFLLFPAILWFELRNIFAREFAPYVNGKRIEVKVRFFGVSLYSSQDIWCKAVDSEKNTGSG